MSIQIQFDAQQEYQLDAIRAITDIFEGQPNSQEAFGEAELSTFNLELPMTWAIANTLLLSRETLLANVQRIQGRSGLTVDNQLLLSPSASSGFPNFSVEMETGTGKTYVYIRTALELSRKYGFRKFIIVVPTLAIKEGVKHTFETTKEHFKSVYDGIQYQFQVYDSKKVSQLRHFAISETVQFLVINIDAFRKNFTGTDEENKSNVIYKEIEGLGNIAPIDFIRSTNPIVIIDEPQSVDNTDKAQVAIDALSPMCALRYSATHKNLYNLVYRLDPVRAFELGLVKQIVVASVTSEDAHNTPYIRLLSVDRGSRLTAKVEIDAKTANGVKRVKKTLKHGDDLFDVSGGRELYQQGFGITEINATPNHEYVEFSDGRTLKLGEVLGGVQHDIWKSQIKTTIRRHLDKELELMDRGVKVLSLFFIDRVSNYIESYHLGNPVHGKFGQYFETCLSELLSLPTYAGLRKHPISELHKGYFAQFGKGVLKDTSGKTQADDEAYRLIMKDKESLLSLETPLRFIFSHSALKEGWDNPNVFQICTLNETKSLVKKRQEIGRGLRLPVDSSGQRIRDEAVNRLIVIANESYEDFARGLQEEYREDCGIEFGKVRLDTLIELISNAMGLATNEAVDLANDVMGHLIASGYLSSEGRIQPAFSEAIKRLDLGLPTSIQELTLPLIDLLKSYRIERHVQKFVEKRPLKLKKEVLLEPNFVTLWERIKSKTKYSVTFDTKALVAMTANAIKQMDRVNPVRLHIAEANVTIARTGVSTSISREGGDIIAHTGSLPDILSFLQKETELTRATIAEIIEKSGRIDEFFANPQEFMERCASVIKTALHELIIDGIKYEKLKGEEYEMKLFETEEIIGYLNNRLEVSSSIYDAIVYDSEVERKFAEDLDRRDDIKLFVKLPSWFKVHTPVGSYNPDWAIVKHEDRTLYLVRETKGTKDYEKLRNSEADKIKCGRRHFEALDADVDFAVVTNASEV